MENPFKSTAVPSESVSAPSGETPDSTESLESKLLGVGARVAEGAKKKRGRPSLPRDAAGNIIGTGKKDSGAGHKKGGSSNVASALTPADEPPVIDKRIVEECVAALLVTVDGVVKDAVGASAMQLTESKPMTESLVNRAAMRPGERDLIAKLTALCTEQYGIAGQHAPLFLLGVTSIVYGGRVFFVLRALRQIAELKARVVKKPGSESLNEPSAPHS